MCQQAEEEYPVDSEALCPAELGPHRAVVARIPHVARPPGDGLPEREPPDEQVGVAKKVSPLEPPLRLVLVGATILKEVKLRPRPNLHAPLLRERLNSPVTGFVSRSPKSPPAPPAPRAAPNPHVAGRSRLGDGTGASSARAQVAFPSAKATARIHAG